MTHPSRLTAAVICAAITVAAPTVAAASLAHPTVVSEDPANYTPNVEPDDIVLQPHVDAIAQLTLSGQPGTDGADVTTIYAGGKFRTVSDADRTQTYPRDHLMAFDADTGALQSFAPVLDGPVWAIETTPDAVYVGGAFTTVNAVTRRALVKLDPVTGAVDTAFDAGFSGGRINEIELVDGRLLVGGSAGTKLMALDPATGLDTGYLELGITGKIENSSGTTTVHRFAVAGTRLVAVGNFTEVSGQSRRRAFMADLGETSATLNEWYYESLAKRCSSTSPRRQAYLSDVDFSPDGSYFVLVSTGYIPLKLSEIGETVCDAAARFETYGPPHPSRPTWINYTGGDTIWSVAVTGSAVYVQGHFKYLDNPGGGNGGPGPGAVKRLGIGAINPNDPAVDPKGGKALPWNPSKPARIGGMDFLATESGLWVGSDSRLFHGEYRRGIAFVPL